MSKNYFKLLLLFTVFTFQSCDEIFECIFNINPEIKNKTLMRGHAGLEYYDTIRAEVNNDSDDDDYFYEFGVFGDLPPGMTYHVHHRTLELLGVPEEPGEYEFEVTVSVEHDPDFWDDDYDASPTCSDTDSRVFTLIIE